MATAPTIHHFLPGDKSLNTPTASLRHPLPSENSASITGARFQGKMQEYILTDVRPIVMTYIMLLVNLGILLMGVRKGASPAE